MSRDSASSGSWALRSRELVAAATLVGTLLWGARADAGFCSGKASGYWCDGNDLVLCSGGAVASKSSCPSGCQSMPPGVNDQCAGGSGFCSGKASGYWCDGSDLVLCSGGSVSSKQHCDDGCKENPPGTNDECKQAAPTGFCSGKASGYWCDGSDLVLCSGGSVSSKQHCDDGCKENPPGTNDECKQAAPTGFCSGKANGLWCDGSDLVSCSGGQVSSKQHCDDGCQENPPGTNDACKQAAPTGFCSGKANGLWCDGDVLVTCSGGGVSAKQGCDNGCQQNAAGTNDQCKGGGTEPPPPPVGFCSGKSDGDWCEGDVLVTCGAGAIAGKTMCPSGCQQNAAGTNDQCKTSTPAGFCGGKADGLWCDGDVLVLCGGGQEQASKPCSGGCQQNPAGTNDECKTAGPSGFCSGKVDGDYCDGDTLVTCSGGAPSWAEQCPEGCQSMPQGIDDICNAYGSKPEAPGPDGSAGVTDSGGCASFSGSVSLKVAPQNQKAHGDQLGFCAGLTIKSDGCTVTALSMLYDYLKMPRSVGGQTGNTPPIENAWRKENGGFGSCGEVGTCCVAWGKNPSGLALQQHYNAATGCVSTDAAIAIVDSLNAGVPVVAGVHWAGKSENQHWVLIVGADGGGLRINDPWGGVADVALGSGALGAYVIDKFFVPYFTPGVGGVVDTEGNPVTDDVLPDGLNGFEEPPPGWRLEDDGELPTFGEAGDWVPVGDATPAAGQGGCTASGGGPLSILLLLFLLVVTGGRRRRAHSR